MNRYTGIAAALLLSLLCLAGCGNNTKKPTDVKVTVQSVNNKTVNELKDMFRGTWETSVVFIDNTDGIQFDIDTYKFDEDGTGIYIPQNGDPENISWDVTPEGDMAVLFDERGELTRYFEYISGNLVNSEDDERGHVETHLYKVEDIHAEEMLHGGALPKNNDIEETEEEK